MTYLNLSALLRIGIVLCIVVLAYTFAAPNRDCYTLYEEGIGDVQHCERTDGRFPDW